MKRHTFLSSAAAAAALYPQLVEAQAATNLTIAGVPEESITPALWAAHSGIFTRNGLNVDVQSQSSGAAIAAGVAGGAYAFGKSSLPSVITAHSKGIPFVFVAGGGLYDSRAPYVKLVVKTDSPYKTAADLNGKTFAGPALTDLATVAAKGWIDQHGGDSSTIKFLEFPFSAVADALAAGRADVGVIADPGLQMSIDSGKVRPFGNFFDSVALQFMNTGWFTTKDYIAANRETVTRFARSMHESTNFVIAHQNDTVDILSKFTGVEASFIAKTHRMSYAPILTARYIQPVIDACAKYKIIPASFDANDIIATGLT